MAKQLLNKKNNQTLIFSDELETDLLAMNDQFTNLPFKTMEQMNERMQLTETFLCTIDSLYGRKDVNYMSQFLQYVLNCVRLGLLINELN